MLLQRQVILPLALGLFVATRVAGQDVDGFVRAWLEAQHVPGAAIAVIRDGVVAKAEGYGLADVEQRVPVTPDTVFKIGSVSKQFIAAGIMLLVQDGRIALDDRVGVFLPEAPQAWEAITLRHLLTHTSGLVREAPGFDVHRLQQNLDVIRTAYPVPLAFAAGEKYQYSNLGYFILAEVLTRVGGQDWGDFLAARVFTPLGMSATRVTTLAQIVPNRARGYAWREGRLQNEDDWPAVRPSGAFLSTVRDLAKWELALSDDRILKRTSKDAMWTRVRFNDGRTFPYGFGWQLDDWPAGSPAAGGITMIRHGGSMNGFRSGYTRWPGHRLAVIVLTNLTNAPYEGLTANVAISFVPELRTVREPVQ